MKYLYTIIFILLALEISFEADKHYQEKMDALDFSFTEESKERMEAKEEVEEVGVIITTTQEIKDYIRETATDCGVDPDLALRIADAKSDFRDVCNSQYGCVAGISVYQIIRTTFDEQCEGDVYNIKDNIDCALLMMSKNQYWRWSQSRHNWQ